MSKEVREFLSSVPAWRDAEIVRLPSGTGSGAWLLRGGQGNGGSQAVVSLRDAKRASFLATLIQEVNVQQIAANDGIAANILYHEDHGSISEYLPGRPLCRRDLEHPQSLQLLVTTLARLHELPLTGRRFEPVTAAKHYLAAISPEHRDEAQRHFEIVSNSPLPTNAVCCHNDLVNENMLVTADAVRLVDFEYAADNDAMFDLATIAETNRLTRRRCSELLSAYAPAAGLPNDRSLMVRLNDARRLYRSLYWLWEAARS